MSSPKSDSESVAKLNRSVGSSLHLLNSSKSTSTITKTPDVVNLYDQAIDKVRDVLYDLNTIEMKVDCSSIPLNDNYKTESKHPQRNYSN